MSSKDIIIVGGGLAGLSLAILCAKSGLQVMLLEKGSYPRQKVCGEYVSMESYDFVQNLGVPLDVIQVPKISRFVLTNPYTQSAQTQMSVGGFGLSRFYLDEKLYEIAVGLGVEIHTECKVVDVQPKGTQYDVRTQKGAHFEADLVVGAYGRISGLEKVKKEKQNEFVGIKYHVDAGPQEDTIEIHSFKGGYCGVSKVENGAFNLCYLAKAADFKACKGDVGLFENTVLKQNPYLAERLSARKLFDPVVTSKLYFGVTDFRQSNHLLLGDAAGFIPPLTGNGMSLAFRSAKELHSHILSYKATGDKQLLHKQNHQYISGYLKGRIQKGIFLQNLLFSAHPIFQKLMFGSFRTFPALLNSMTKQAVGEKL